jgi:hypothetical protein
MLLRFLLLENISLKRKLEQAYTSSNFGCYNRVGAEAKGNEFLRKERRRVASGELVMVCCDIAGMGRRNSEIGEIAVNNAISLCLKTIHNWRGVHFVSQLNSGDEFVFVVDRVDVNGIIPRMDALFKDAGFDGIYGAVSSITNGYIQSANDGMQLVYRIKSLAKKLKHAHTNNAQPLELLVSQLLDNYDVLDVLYELCSEAYRRKFIFEIIGDHTCAERWDEVAQILDRHLRKLSKRRCIIRI